MLEQVVHDKIAADNAAAIVTPEVGEMTSFDVAVACGISISQAEQTLEALVKSSAVQKRTVVVSKDISGKSIQRTLYKEAVKKKQ